MIHLKQTKIQPPFKVVFKSQLIFFDHSQSSFEKTNKKGFRAWRDRSKVSIWSQSPQLGREIFCHNIPFSTMKMTFKSQKRNCYLRLAKSSIAFILRPVFLCFVWCFLVEKLFRFVARGLSIVKLFPVFCEDKLKRCGVFSYPHVRSEQIDEFLVF